MEKVKELYKSFKKAHQENERLCKENQSLLASSSCDRDYQDAALEANRSLEDIVKQLYRELGTLQKIVGVLMSVQGVVKAKGVQLKEPLIAIDIMHEWSTTHPTSPETWSKER